MTSHRGGTSRAPLPEQPAGSATEEWDLDYPPTVLVDASNVAHAASADRSPRLVLVRIVLAALRDAGVRYAAWADGNLRYEIDAPAELEDLIDLGEISEVRREPADARLLSEANELLRSGMPAYLLSRDRFRNHPEATGIPRVEFEFDAHDRLTLRPPPRNLLTARGYAVAHPDLMPLPAGVTCGHPRSTPWKSDRRGRAVCLRCGETFSPPARGSDRPRSRSSPGVRP